jgi:hypothetical protein
MRGNDRIASQAGESAITGPSIIAGRGDKCSTNRVEVNVSAGSEQVMVALHKTGTIAAFP